MKRILASLVLIVLLFRTKEGPWVYYHDNGQLSGKGNYKDGKHDGPWVSYSSDGSEVVED
jgi:antitoxin component YwqK of YwqJK toxin-antitoxin module